MAALDSNALSITDFAKLSNDPKIMGVAMSLVKHHAILQDIPFLGSKTLKATGSRWENLPSTNWVPLNKELATVDGAPVQHSENVYVMRDLIKTDSLMRDDVNAIEDPHVARINAYLQSRSYNFNEMFINNDPSLAAGDKNAIVGLRGRLDNPNTFKVNSANKIGSGGVFTSAATAAEFIGVLENIDDLLDAVNDLEGNTTVIYCSKAFLKRFSQLARIHAGVGGFGRAQDQYDRFTFKYRGAVLRDVGVKQDQSTQIIASTEAADGEDGSDKYTSIYAVNYSEFRGIMNSMKVQQLPPEQGFLHSTLIELACGLFPVTSRCIGRLHGIQMTA